eukprot:TRINITY_DN9325_c0_g1_i1.p2 TRINITY_DN9325_c0_g1~~TRINITY_DN9325_c0_g1_i1.p2  ORF type:complete len:163 (-),score=36.87 TRINITY_DN9325_c0_g1_i1:333-821(-)
MHGTGKVLSANSAPSPRQVDRAKLKDQESKTEHVLTRIDARQHGAEKMIEKRELMMDRILEIKRQIDDKDNELKECRNRHGKISENLEEKKRRRDALQVEVEKHTKKMADLLKQAKGCSRLCVLTLPRSLSARRHESGNVSSDVVGATASIESSAKPAADPS